MNALNPRATPRAIAHAFARVLLVAGAAVSTMAAVPARAGVSIDSFNSANAALAPSGGMDADTLQRSSRRGPVDALVEFTHRQRMQAAREAALAAVDVPASPAVAAIETPRPVGTR